MGTKAARILALGLKGNTSRARIELSPSFIARSSTNTIGGMIPRPFRCRGSRAASRQATQPVGPR